MVGNIGIMNTLNKKIGLPSYGSPDRILLMFYYISSSDYLQSS